MGNVQHSWSKIFGCGIVYIILPKVIIITLVNGDSKTGSPIFILSKNKYFCYYYISIISLSIQHHTSTYGVIIMDLVKIIYI